MLPPDLAFALLINRTSDYYQAHPPVYMTYTERTHVTAASRARDMDRSIAVRVADNLAIMQDLPNGARRTGQAFPIIAYFDPFSAFAFGYFANLKRVDITLERGRPLVLATPEPDPSVNAVVPYNSYWASRYAPDSSEAALHLLIDPTPRVSNNNFYPSEVVEDPQTHLPSHVEMRLTGSDETIALDYKVIDGHWVITHGVFSATEHVLITFKVVADVTFSDIAFPAQAPDPQLAGSPLPPTQAPASPGEPPKRT